MGRRILISWPQGYAWDSFFASVALLVRAPSYPATRLPISQPSGPESGFVTDEVSLISSLLKPTNLHSKRKAPATPETQPRHYQAAQRPSKSEPFFRPLLL